MNLLLFDAQEISHEGTVYLQDRRSEHLIKILGCKPGNTIRAGIVNGPLGTAMVVALSGNNHKARIELNFRAEDVVEPAQSPTDLIMGMVRPIMLKRVLSQAASLGVGRIFLINARRVEKSFFNASLLKNENYKTFLVQGLEQARDTRLPSVSIHKRFRPFVEDFIPGLADEYDRMLVAHPGQGLNLKKVAGTSIKGKTLLAVGPEGGWLDFELEKFKANSFVQVSLGERVLRTDTAVVALLAQLRLLQEE